MVYVLADFLASNLDTELHVYKPASSSLTSLMVRTLSTITVPSLKYGFLLVTSESATFKDNIE